MLPEKMSKYTFQIVLGANDEYILVQLTKQRSLFIQEVRLKFV